MREPATRGSKERAELLVLKDVPPFLIADGRGRRFGGFFWRQTAITSRNGHSRLFVIRPDRTTHRQDHCAQKGNNLFHVSYPQPERCSARAPTPAPSQRPTIFRPDRRSQE